MEPDIAANRKRVGKAESDIKHWQRLLETKEELHPDLADCLVTLDSGMVCIKHPLINSIMHIPQLNAQVNESYRYKREQLQKAAEKKDWATYVFWHEKPFKMWALANISQHLSIEQRSKMLAEIWTLVENCWQCDDYFEWIVSFGIDANAAMDEEERKVWSELPETFTVYRGAQEHNVYGRSWTLEKERAEWFARRFNEDAPMVLRGKVSKGDPGALFYINGRNEQEILVSDPRSVTIIEKEYL